MFKQLTKTWALIATLLGIKVPPIKDGKIDFDDDQKSKLMEQFGKEFTEDVIKAFNEEIAQNSFAEEFEQAQEEVKAMLKEAGYSEEEQREILGSENLEGVDTTKMSAQFKQMTQSFLDLKAQLNEQDKQIQKLLREPEPEETTNLIEKGMKMFGFKHSATHLFASGKSWDAFENRPWNARFRDGGIKATDFNTGANIPLLIDDAEHFIREYPAEITSLFDDFDTLPKEWSRRSGVIDRVSTGFIMPAEIVQGRSKGWNPKNNFKIEAEEAKVWAKKIDIEFNGQELQTLETTWIQTCKNLDGSQPWKMSFIAFLLSELIKRQALDDRRAQISGIFVPTPDGDEFAGAALNSQSGLFWLWWYFRDVVKKIRPFHLGAPTNANIVDYVRAMIENMPIEARTLSGWEIQITEEMYRAYCKKAGDLYDKKYSTDLGKDYYPLNHPIDYPNFKFQVLKDHTKSKFIGIVQSSNVEILDYLVDEKGKFTIGHEKRNTYIFADYRLGIRFKAVGMKAEPGDPQEFEKQLLYCNDVPIFDTAMAVPAFDDESGILKINYSSVRVDKSWKTNITNIEGLKDGPYLVDLKGQIITITGNTAINGSPKVKHGQKISLAGGADFDLTTGGTLTLYANDNGTFTELSRTNSAPTPVTGIVEFTGSAIDADEGNLFHFKGGSNATLTDIVGGVHGQKITITKTENDSVSLTISAVPDLIVVSSTATLDAKNDTITFINVNGVWYELSRNIA